MQTVKPKLRRVVNIIVHFETGSSARLFLGWGLVLSRNFVVSPER